MTVDLDRMGDPDLQPRRPDHPNRLKHCDPLSPEQPASPRRPRHQGHELVEAREELPHGLGRRRVADLGDDVEGEERTTELLQRAEEDPARARGDDGDPPACARRLDLRRHEAQVVDLLADLRDERQCNAGAGAERDEAERRVAAGDAAVLRPVGVRGGVRPR